MLSQFRARLVTYADDFVILSRGEAAESLEWTRGVLERLELTLNEKEDEYRSARIRACRVETLLDACL
jgi:RNA-directed DNA polymerase